jgi:hypothetical protein
MSVTNRLSYLFRIVSPFDNITLGHLCKESLIEYDYFHHYHIQPTPRSVYCRSLLLIIMIRSSIPWCMSSLIICNWLLIGSANSIRSVNNCPGIDD